MYIYKYVLLYTSVHTLIVCAASANSTLSQVRIVLYTVVTLWNASCVLSYVLYNGLACHTMLIAMRIVFRKKTPLIVLSLLKYRHIGLLSRKVGIDVMLLYRVTL